MALSQIKFVTFVNKWIWKSREFIKELKEYREYLVGHIEWIEGEIRKHTDNEILERLINHRQERIQELEVIKEEIIYSKNKQKYYTEIANQYNIFG